MQYTEQPKQLQDGRYFSKIYKENGNRYLTQLNRVTILSNLSETPSVVLDVSNHIDKLKNIDSLNLSAAEINSQSWFGKVLSLKTLEAAYVSPINTDNEITVTKLNRMGIFNHQREELSVSDLPENTVCDVILELSGLIFSKKSFSPVWRLVQVKTVAPPKKVEYLFEEEQAEPDSEDEFA